MDKAGAIRRIDNDVAVLSNKIKRAEETNAKRDEYYDKYLSHQQCLNRIDTAATKLNMLFKGSMKIMEKFRGEVIEDLENKMEAILGIVLPDEAFKVKIEYTVSRGKYHTKVLLGKQNKNGEISWGDPRAQNGDFIKQLVSFSLLAGMNLLMGSEMLFMDEPFSSSDLVNVRAVGGIFNLIRKTGLQMLFIEHKPELYQDIEHNLISLYKERSKFSEEAGIVHIVEMGVIGSAD